VDRFGTYFAHEIRKRRSERMRQSPQWQWHLDEVFVKIRGQTHYLWRAVDHEGEVLEPFVTKTRDKASALKFMRKAMKRYGNPLVVVTDKLRSYGAAMDESGRCCASGECEVSRNSLQSIRLCTITSIIKGIT
jgi:putative transposase